MARKTTIILIVTMAFIFGCAPDYVYEMPNGVQCENKSKYSSIIFSKCSDGLVYVNPPTYRKVKPTRIK
jgi:hypothetical protein